MTPFIWLNNSEYFCNNSVSFSYNQLKKLQFIVNAVLNATLVKFNSKHHIISQVKRYNIDRDLEMYFHADLVFMDLIKVIQCQ